MSSEITKIIDFNKKRKKILLKAQKDATVRYIVVIGDDVNLIKNINGKSVHIQPTPIKEITIELYDNARAEIIGIIVGKGSQKISLKTTLHHKGKGSSGDIKVRSVLKEKAALDFIGMIKIDKAAQHTKSYLEAKSLALNKGVICNALPELEIEADDVQASHSFSQSQIEEEQLFYLRTRGLTKEQAQDMIVKGFLNDIRTYAFGDVLC